MANSDVASGLSPVRYLSGAPYNGACNTYSVPSDDSAAAIYIGDPVKLAGGADTDGVATVTLASSTDPLVGVVVGVKAITRSSTIYRENSTARYVQVADDPNLVYEVQEVSGGDALTAAAVGLNANWTGSSGSTITGRSDI